LQVNALSRSISVVDEKGRPSQELNLFSEACSRLPVLIGLGSPEGVVEAQVSRLYMNSAGTAGSILYIKRDADIGGDKSQGWILV
jgi:hypothetical protein